MVISIKELNKVAVIGMGASGLSALRFLKFMGRECYAINQGSVDCWGHGNEVLDTLDDDHKVSQADALEILSKCELVILSPGVPRDIELLKTCKVPIWNEVELAYQFLSSEEVVAITGTNGKTTTVTFLEECLKYEGVEYFVGGNIGTPFCDYAYAKLSGERKRAEIILLELSSFQLESMHSFRANSAAILNITFSHGERYDHLKDYALAKIHICDNQKKQDSLFFPDQLLNDLGLNTPDQGQSLHPLDIDKEIVTKYLEKIIDLNELKIYGFHNLLNLYFAHKLWRTQFGNNNSFIKACKSFEGVKYRFQLISNQSGLKIFNDAKSTNWEAMITALNGVSDNDSIYLVLGGKLRGEGDNQLDLLGPFKNKIKKIFLIGESGQSLMQDASQKFDCEYVNDLNGLKKSVQRLKPKGSLVFSPAFPSFDQFKNYIERGESFSQLFKS